MLYSYVGSESIRRAVAKMPPGTPITDLEVLLDWVEARSYGDDLTATFTITPRHIMQLAERRSEHVACAAGGPVAGAGEITFSQERGSWFVSEITNQSTGFCPDPSCWNAVARVLDAIGIEHPGRFTRAYDFRRCDACGELALVKEQWFVCAHCEAELPRDYNLGPA